MLKITDYKLDSEKQLSNVPEPVFEKYAPDIPHMKCVAEQYKDKKNVAYLQKERNRCRLVSTMPSS